MQMTQNIINAGNILMVNYGIYYHVGVADGLGFVYENSQDKGGIGKVSLDEFSEGREVKNAGMLGNLSANEIILNAENLIKDNKSYKLFSNNCEHFIREVCNVDVKSPQIRAKFVSASFLTLAFYARNPIVKVVSASVGIATLATKDEEDLARNVAIATGVSLLTFLLIKND
jgi:hypothetical protein